MFKKIAVAASLAVLASSAFAGVLTNVYAGADFGTTKADDLVGRSSSFGSFVGYQITPMFGVEANIRRLVDTSESFTNVRALQTGLSVVGTYPLNDDFSVFGRVGYNRLRVRITNATLGTDDDTESKAMYGVGVSFAITPVIAARVEYQKPRSDVKNLSASVVFKF